MKIKTRIIVVFFSEKNYIKIGTMTNIVKEMALALFVHSLF